jgi:type VI secretion system protein ImpK
MSDNPFSEPDDSDRTVLRPQPGGRRAAPVAPLRQPEPELEPPPPIRGPQSVVDAAESVPMGVSPLVAAAGPLLQLVARLRNTANQPDPGELRERAVQALRTFERRARDAGIAIELVRPAHYALCASIDDVVLNTPWGGTGVWDSRSLVTTFHQQTVSGERFFNLLAQMRQHPGRFLPVIELMYLCMSLGFQGQYRLSARGHAELDRLREETYALIMRQRQPAEPELSPHWRGVLSPFRGARFTVPVWVAIVVAVAILAGLFAWLRLSIGTASDDLYARMLRAPPGQMAGIVHPQAAPRTTPLPVAPVRQPPPPPADDPLCAKLEPLQRQGVLVLVQNSCTSGTPIVRLNASGMFASGSATVQSQFVPILEQIGDALREEAGELKIVGYTDNRPIHTLQFTDNVALSQARAEAAKKIIVGRLGDPSRATTSGRGEAQPIAPNNTPEGQQQNRRVEIELHRPSR